MGLMTEEFSRFDLPLGEALIKAAKAMRPLLERNAAENERLGELTPEVIQAITEAGFLKMAIPRRWGGLHVSSTTMTNVTAEISKGCPSTGWIVSIANSTTWMGSRMSDAMQQTIFADGVPSLCGPNNGMGTLVPQGDGYVLNGKWAYGSNSHHATLALVPALGPEKTPKLALLSMSQARIENTWKVAGMKGTGSDTVVVENLFLPARNICDAAGITSIDPSEYAKEASDHWLAFPLLRSKAMGVLLGTVEGLLESVIAGQSRPILYTSFAKKSDSAVYRASVGQAAAKIRAARGLIIKTTLLNDSAAAAASELTVQDRVDCRADSAVAMTLLADAANALMDLAGSSGFNNANSAQRYWRDFNVGSRHVIFNSDISYEIYGSVVLGLEQNIVVSDFL